MDQNWQSLKELRPPEPSEALKSKIRAQFRAKTDVKPRWHDRLAQFCSPFIGRGWVAPMAIVASLGACLIVIGGGLMWQKDKNATLPLQSDPLAQEQTIEEMEFILGL